MLSDVGFNFCQGMEIVEAMREAVIGIGLAWIMVASSLVAVTSLIYLIRDNIRHL